MMNQTPYYDLSVTYSISRQVCLRLGLLWFKDMNGHAKGRIIYIVLEL
jgi:hypothetical protein